jgi:hypothetical protein
VLALGRVGLEPGAKRLAECLVVGAKFEIHLTNLRLRPCGS